MRPMLPNIAVVLATAISSCSASKELSTADYSKSAAVRVLEVGAPLKISRTSAIAANPALDRACGLAITADGRALLFRADGLNADRNGSVRIYDPQSGSTTDRIATVFDMELAEMACERADVLPPAPRPGFVAAETHARLRRLWDENPPKWAIIPVPATVGYVAVQRRSGGGQIISPIFPTEAAVQRWLATGGDQKAAEENAVGRAAMAQDQSCLSAAQTNAERDKCDPAGMDQTVQLH